MHCFRCGQPLLNKFSFCPSCGTKADNAQTRKVKACKACGSSLGKFFRSCPVCPWGSNLRIALVSAALLGTVLLAPWFQNLAMNLDSKDVGLELQVGNASSNWLYASSTFRAKVSLPNALSDSATVKLERLDGGVWVDQISKEVSKSTTVALPHTFASEEKTSLRVALYSGSRLIQTSNVKSVQGIKAPKGDLTVGGNTYYRYFTQAEYDSVSTPGCGSYCWGLWVSTPTKSTLTLWLEDEGKVITKKVEVTISKVGVLKKVIIPSIGIGKSGYLKIESRPATAEELQEASRPAPRPNTNGGGTPAGCEERSRLLDLYDQVVVEGESWGFHKHGVYGFLRPTYFESDYRSDKYEALQAKLLRIKDEIFRCNYEFSKDY